MIRFIVSILAVTAFASTVRSQENPWVVYNGFAGPGKGKHIILVSGDEEYRSEEALPQLGKILAKHHGFKCTVLFAIDPKSGEINPNVSNIPGLEALKTADLMIIATRFRNLPDAQMQHIVDYIEAGKAIIGMRTATHAFLGIKGKFAKYNNGSNDKGYEGGFGRQVLGEKWVSHHGNHGTESTRGIVNKEQSEHPILRGIKDGDIWGPSDVYGANPLQPATVLVFGQVLVGMKSTDEPVPGTKELIAMLETSVNEVQSMVSAREKSIFDDLKETVKPLPDKKSKEYAKLVAGHPQAKELAKLKATLGGEKQKLTNARKNLPMMPLAWTREYKGGRIFTTTLGASQDLEAAGSRRLLVNAAYWTVGLEQKIAADLQVDTVGEFKPTRFGFNTFTKGIRPEHHKLEAGNPKNELLPQEKEILDMINKFRAEHKVPALKISPLLCELSRKHSENMAKQDKLDHVLDGKGPGERCKEAGYNGYRGENIAGGGANMPKFFFELWVNSEGHRKNLLGEHVEMGVGFARTKSDETDYYTALFGVGK